MKLRDYLRVPFVLEACSCEVADGEWTNRVSYPELGDCAIEGTSFEAIVDSLERRRVTMILDRLSRGVPVSVPRAPDENIEPRLLLEQLDLIAEFERWLDLDELDLQSK